MTSYFAYGSNMDTTQMRKRCPDATFLNIAVLRSYRFIINILGFATVVSQSSCEVYGTMWNITEKCEKSLDNYEGIKSKIYTKSTVNVEMEIGKTIPALIYLASNNTPGSPKNGYMEKILAASVQHKLPGKYIQELKTWLPTNRSN
jgi:gamma-glutamylcyclotransferase (GGCT)/AIG2-like uncharacterized protein YtfP